VLWLAIVCAILVVSVGGWLRSRKRMREVMAAPLDQVPICAVEGRAAAQFFDETRFLRLAIEDMLQATSRDATDVLHGDTDLDAVAVNHGRRVIDWAKRFYALDSGDREALHDLGASAGWVDRISRGQSVTHAEGLRMMHRDLWGFEQAMTARPRGGHSYRQSA
jgi:hypothetical protein